MHKQLLLRQTGTAMKFPFFGKDNGDSEPEEDHEGDIIIPTENTEIVPTIDNDGVDLALYDHVKLDAKAIGGAAFADALIPMAAKSADAMAQWDHAIVRFPKGAGWNDLLNRKTPGWEEWKQLGILKDGKFQPQAAIRQAKLSPVTVANLALQGAAIVVGQAYMTEISKQLESIKSGIAAIQQEMRLEREADIEARFERLFEYISQYEEISTNPEKKQAVLNTIEGICVETLKAWKFQVKAMREFGAHIESPKRMKDDEVRAKLNEFQGRERDALAAFRLFLAAEQASMQYDEDFSAARIAREREKVERCLTDYAEVRDNAQTLLTERINNVRGGLLAVPDAEKDDYEHQNVLFDLGHFVTHNAPRITPVAMRKEAQKQAAINKDCYRQAAGVADPIALIGEERENELARMNFIYNEADAMLIDGDGVYFLKTRADKTELKTGESEASENQNADE
ncbi:MULTISPECIES: hypothetical protein [Mobiluncus]|uniref:Uncharacterized protein n=2 Tax=Mobiluncus TaxID=2050 RepID=E6M1A9_9ACTO|nr:MULTISPECIES: hypothetical protein [Mobiluncus]EFU79444.1 hypothetical protein HMPREF0388_1547 [Mobiluncus curtisii ATCC 51333]EFU82928.1 hypothetical protein HMPREF0576_0258 [Mobiluncus holmesii ATCC 35242]NMW44277.1 hypothetical protein [Mobiluncus curtisii]NMW83050.1 hypothetical protein [Mobiluncus curtisii]NMW98646.1 hypothetical protein [Mobiluncus curtisii]